MAFLQGLEVEEPQVSSWLTKHAQASAHRRSGCDAFSQPGSYELASCQCKKNLWWTGGPAVLAYMRLLGPTEPWIRK